VAACKEFKLKISENFSEAESQQIEHAHLHIER
jgi:hypothetical protein